jgi:hypothetical protein
MTKKDQHFLQSAKKEKKPMGWLNFYVDTSTCFMDFKSFSGKLQQFK